MVAVPEEMPVTIPVLPTVATDVVLLLHIPPKVAFVKVVVAPIHRVEEPAIGGAAGKAFTLKIAVLIALPQLPVTE